MIQNFDLDKLPSIKLLDKAKLPKIASIYFVTDSNNRLLYIGKAQNIYQRWLNHHRYEQLAKINRRNLIYLKWYKCENNEVILTKLENYFINLYQPELNQTKVEAKNITPAEVTLRKTLIKISKYVIIYGYEKNSRIFKLPTVFLKYDYLNRNPASILRKIFNADNKKGNLKWSYYRRVQTTPIWKTKCNGICIVVGCDTGINHYIQNGHSTTLAGIFLLNLFDKDFQDYVVEKDRSQSYHPNIERYTNDLIPLLWTKDQIIEQPNVAEIKELNKKRTESKIGKGRTRGRQIKVYCEAIGRGKFVIKAYEEAIEWFGGCEILGLKKAEYKALGIDNAPKWFKPHKVTVRIPEGNSYRSISAPISASADTELEERLEQIRQISSLHQRIRFKRQ